jgi:hypothetical protein
VHVQNHREQIFLHCLQKWRCHYFLLLPNLGGKGCVVDESRYLHHGLTLQRNEFDIFDRITCGNAAFLDVQFYPGIALDFLHDFSFFHLLVSEDKTK